ncbi:MAG: hypothetical protein WCO85_09340 [Actinomycetes bacterium]
MIKAKVVGKKLDMLFQITDKIFSLRTSLSFPLAHIVEVTQDPEVAKKPKGVRMPGTYIPGILTAGTYVSRGKKVFWCVRKPSNAVVITLKNERFSQLVFEVKNPQELIDQINLARSI